LALSGSMGPSCTGPAGSSRKAEKIVDQSGVAGGLIVHYQCGRGDLTSALRINERYIVHGLDRNAEDILSSRTRISSAGHDASVSVMHWENPFLPYSENLVNLFVSEEVPDIAMGEILRVLVPGGVAMVGGRRTVKPVPEDLDDWQQTRYDHTNNGVSSDTVGPPRHLRWTSSPPHARSHEENSSTMAVVTAEGRIFYIQDEGLMGISDPRLPSSWKLVARDAYNGTPLWKLDIPEWGWQVWEQKKKQEIWPTKMAQRHQFPAGMARRLIARGEQVFMTLGYTAPVSVIDASSGEVSRTLEQTEYTDEIVLVDDMLLALQRRVPAEDRNSKVEPVENPSTIRAINVTSGKTAWTLESPYIWQWSLISDGEQVFYYDGVNEMIHSVDLETGNPLWQVASGNQKINTAIYIGLTFLVHDGILFYMGQEQLSAYDAATGELLWTAQGKGPSAPVYHNQPSLFVSDGHLWIGGPAGRGEEGDMMTGYDIRTGMAARTVEPGCVITPGHHYRCFPPRATERYIIMPKRGAEFIDLEGSNSMKHDWLRGACRFGYIPANNLFYVTPHPCFCYPGVLINGFYAFASGSKQPAGDSGQEPHPLVRGVAYSAADEARTRPVTTEPWPMYRHDHERSGGSGMDVPVDLTRLWEVNLGGKPVQPVVAGDRLYVAERTTDRVVCLDRQSGRQIWEFTADAEVDSPPTFHRGLLLFGCTDGHLYCLDAGSGQIAWKFRVAPRERMIMDDGRLQSAWPVHGSVIVVNDIVYASAGRSSFLDGGIYLAGIDLFSGEPVYRGRLEGPYPDLSHREGTGFYMDGGLNDLLVTDGEFIYLRQNKFDLELNHIPVAPIHREPPEGTKGRGDKGDRDVGMHLFATGGMLDDSFWNRNFWMHSERWPGFYIGNQAPKSGQLVVFDRENTYAVKHYMHKNAHSPMSIPGRDGYLVYADPNDTPMNLYDGTEETLPLEWLPTPIKVLEGMRMLAEETLDYPAVNFDKGPGFTRRTPPLWMQWHPVRFLAMSRGGERLVLCGVPDEMPEEDPLAAFEGRMGARLVILDARDGRTCSVFELDRVPVFDGISIGQNRIYISSTDGRLLCLGKEEQKK